MELVAAEPLVADPIAIAWGPEGKLWVVQMGDYPLGSDAAAAGGQIRFLEDVDGDGRYDRATVFLDGLRFPTGVMPWRRGVLVTCAPHIFYAEDRDGDGRADFRDDLFSGFAEGNQQHRVNGLVWGLDNWIHCANGDSGGVITSPQTVTPIDIHGHDFRIRPERGLLDLQAGMTQFGRCRDDWGNWFGGNSAWPFWHRALNDRYLRRNHFLKPPDPCVHLMTPAANAPVFPASRPLPRLNEMAMVNRLTSACGACVYRDELLGASFRDNYFVCEPAHNLVHRQVMIRKGVSFESARPVDERQSEFLASRDAWFRPTQVRTGPDGALWVVDMYRLVIEHPDWVSDQWQAQLDLRAGDDKGRIYRVFPQGRPPRPPVRLGSFDTPSLVSSLDSPNGPQRDLAQMLLVQGRDESAAMLLEDFMRQSVTAQGRLSALCTLDGLDAVRPETLLMALSDPHPAVRRHAVRISECFLGAASLNQDAAGAAGHGHRPAPTKLLARLGQLVNDVDAQVRLQLAYTLGECGEAWAGHALTKLALRDADDDYLRAAVMSSATRHLPSLLDGVLAQPERSATHVALLQDFLLLALATDQENLLAKGLGQLRKPTDADRAWQFDLLAGLLDAFQQRGTPLSRLRERGTAPLRSALDDLAGVFQSARRTAVDGAAASDLRQRAIGLLGREPAGEDGDLELLANLLASDLSWQLGKAAVAALGRLDRADVPQLLLRNWQRHDLQVWHGILDALLTRSDWTRQLLERMEAREVPPAALGTVHRNRLLLHHVAEVRQRAGALLNTPASADRRRVVEQYQGALRQVGDPQRGALLFRQHCAACHLFGGEGSQVGPDLRMLTDRSPEALLVAILDPNRSVQPRSLEFAAVSRDGRVFQGIRVAETSNTVTLAGPHGERTVLLRTDLDQLVSMGKSMMPEGLEQILSQQQLADLLAYLR